jgi:hypothetical protein
MRNRHAIEPVAGAVQRPSCGLPATITDRFTPHGSSGRIDHVELASVGGHPLRATTDSLPDGPHESRRVDATTMPTPTYV